MKTVKAKALVLRTCKSDMTSHNGFVWPTSGPVECPDWIPSNVCGNGLHGALWGEGDGSLLNWGAAAVWQVVEIDEYIDLGDKVKFPRGVVVHTGNQLSATQYISDNGAKGAIIGGTDTVGDNNAATVGFRGKATAGEFGTATAGEFGTAIAGKFGTATAGHYGTATAGEFGTATAGDNGTAIAGYSGTATAGVFGTATAGYSGTAIAAKFGTATAGHYGTATAGEFGTATAGDNGTAIAGYSGTATAGVFGTATAGDNGTATAGHYGTIQIKYWDGTRMRVKTAYVGEDGIEANVPYKLDRDGNFVKAGLITMLKQYSI